MLKKCGLAGGLERDKKLASSMIIPVIDDELTNKCIRGLKRFKGKDDNGLERLEFLAEGIGWFYVEMCLAQEIFQYHGGRLDDAVLARDSVLLSRKHFNAAIEKRHGARKGTQSNVEKSNQHGGAKPDAVAGDPGAQKKLEERSAVPTAKRLTELSHHNIDELIFHTFEARILDCWIRLAQVDNLKLLADWNHDPAELRELAEQIVKEFASVEAVDDEDAPPRQKPTKSRKGGHAKLNPIDMGCRVHIYQDSQTFAILARNREK